jgi:hypothetical protein
VHGKGQNDRAEMEVEMDISRGDIFRDNQFRYEAVKSIT